VELIAEGEAGAIATTVYFHEMVGRDLQISLRLGSDIVRYRTRVLRGVNIGDRLHLRLKLDGARLFDRRTGKALRPNRKV